MTTNKNPLTWIKQYPVKALIFIFLFLIPVIFLTVFLTTTTKNKTRFYFETDEFEKPVYLNKGNLISTEELDELLTLNIKLKDIVKPLETFANDEPVYSGGKYSFDVSYQIKDNVKGTFQFQWMLDTVWNENRSQPSSLSISNTTATRDIPYNFHLPFRKYFFFKVERPHLYLKITRINGDVLPGFPAGDQIYYYRIDLNQYKPSVIDPN